MKSIRFLYSPCGDWPIKWKRLDRNVRCQEQTVSISKQMRKIVLAHRWTAKGMEYVVSVSVLIWIKMDCLPACELKYRIANHFVKIL